MGINGPKKKYRSAGMKVKPIKVKVKVLPVQATKALRVSRGSSTQLTTSALNMGVGGQRHAPAALP
jgi:hypothetical protein